MGGQNIILVGFMGVGKTVVGRRLAHRSQRPFVDVDREIELLLKMSVTMIFKKYGQIRFRSEEELMLAKICGSRSNVVISTGGGVVLKPTNREIMKAAGTVVWLQASAETIVQRVGLGKSRPLLRGRQVAEVVQELQRERWHLYEQIADIIITTDGKQVEQLVDEIISRVNKERGNI